MSSGYQPFAGHGQKPAAPPPLAPGWTEHRAPTGHMYYYHPETKTSTYTRPVAAPTDPPVPSQQAYPLAGGFQNQNYPKQFDYNRQQRHDNTHRRPRPQEKPDKPKTKRAIPDAAPWLFVTTKKGNTFIHNPETKESLWAVPDGLKDAIEGLEKLSLNEERERERVRRRQSALEKQRQEQEDAMADQEEFDAADQYDYEDEEGDGGIEDGTESHGIKRQVSAAAEGDEPEDEYYDDEDDFDEEHDLKRIRMEQGGPVEFTEDDIDWQLGAMAEQYGLGEEDMEGNEDLAPEDGAFLFKDLLDDLQINPYSTWESEMPKLVEDGRYTTLPTTKLRKQVFSDWCQERIAVIKAEKEKEIKKDPRIAYLNFIEANATPKLYWPEFKRKFKKEPEMKDSKVSDRDREKYYRDYISRTKTSVETRENDLRKYLRTVKDLTRRTDIDNLPTSVSCDIRFVAVPKDRRDSIVLDHIRTLPDDAGTAESSSRDALEKQRRALQDREEAVRREQFYNSKDIARGKEALRETEMEIKRAMNVGKEGLLSHLEPAKEKDPEKDDS
ncbi:hypothetical protein H072_4007 [Dactylellina haptotyla CBS 200.50]|uniref:WW domain-containing protein n=1 Tax=Dactylellina haptotyla (strain CBS 200.50) TaxID=1284197 RepID=S8C2Y2_DACHA|nr:hypothetical protein H072_4007 [Dactylellina haptotyla CBS 200.50]